MCENIHSPVGVLFCTILYYLLDCHYQFDSKLGEGFLHYSLLITHRSISVSTIRAHRSLAVRAAITAPIHSTRVYACHRFPPLGCPVKLRPKRTVASAPQPPLRPQQQRPPHRPAAAIKIMAASSATAAAAVATMPAAAATGATVTAGKCEHN